MRGLRQLKFGAAVLAVGVLVACSTGGDNPNPQKPEPVVAQPDNPVVVGQEDFLTIERDYYGWYGYGPEAGAGASEDSSAPPAANEKAPGGRVGDVEEADIYRVDNNRLFYLNTYRGFVIYDLNDPKNPQRISRLPVHGYPIEMFVSGNTVFALLRDALYVTQGSNGLRFKRHNVSQLVAIDITDITRPKVVKTIDIVGELKEGVSRKIADTIYVVSHIPQSYYWYGYPYGADRTEQAWVYSFNVANPANPIVMGKLKIFEGGSSSQQSNNSSTSRWFSSVAISATANTLHVVENWYTYGWVSGSNYSCGSYRSMQEAVVSIIDISDPTGVIRLHSHFSTYGALTDQFKHTYVHDPVTGKGHYFGIFARQEWQSIDCQGTSFTQNTLEAWDVTDGANPVRVSSLKFGKPNETVRGTAYDTARGVAYAITAQRIDPLYAIRISDPNNLQILSEVDGLSGDMTVFRLIGGGNFLIGIGRDTSETCTGFGSPTTGWSANVAVSVIDVQNLNAIRLVQRRCVTIQDAAWVWSEISWNLDQAHKMIGMHSDARANVISVPVSYYSKSQGQDGWYWYRPESAVGLMSFDLAAYDPAKDHLNQTVLKNHGTVVHDKGHVRRSVVFTHKGLTDRRMMANLSDTHVSVVDIDDLDAPVKQSVIEIAPNHSRLYRFGNYVVDEVRQGDDYYSYYGAGTTSEFRVKTAAPGMDEAQPVATFSVSGVQQVVQFNDLLVVFRPREGSQNQSYYDRQSEALVYDLSNPAAPVLASTTSVPVPYYGYNWFWCGTGWGYWPYYGTTAWAANDRGLAMITSKYPQNRSEEQHLIFLDLANPAAPAVTDKLLSTITYDSNYRPVGRRYVGLMGDGQKLVASFNVRAGELSHDGMNFAVMRYFVEPFDSNLTAQSPVNVPGRLVRAWIKDGEWRFLTTDERFSKVHVDQYNYDYWMPEARLHLLGRAGAQNARVLDTLNLEQSQLGDLVGDSEKLLLTLRRGYYYGYYGSNASEEDLGDRLNVIDLRQDTLNRTFNAPVGTWYSQLMGVSHGRLFVNLPGDGVLAVDVSDVAHPRGQHFVRTLGYATHIAFAQDRAFIAAGNFGIYEMDLSAPASVAVLD